MAIDLAAHNAQYHQRPSWAIRLIWVAAGLGSSPYHSIKVTSGFGTVMEQTVVSNPNPDGHYGWSDKSLFIFNWNPHNSVWVLTWQSISVTYPCCYYPTCESDSRSCRVASADNLMHFPPLWLRRNTNHLAWPLKTSEWSSRLLWFPIQPIVLIYCPPNTRRASNRSERFTPSSPEQYELFPRLIGRSRWLGSRWQCRCWHTPLNQSGRPQT